MRWKLMGAAALLVGATTAHADAVTEWNANAISAAHAACLAENPLSESRLYAMVQLAVHDAVNAIERHSRPYAYAVKAPIGSSPDAAVATAAHDVLVSQIPKAGVPPECVSAGTQRAEADYQAAMSRIGSGAAKDAGVASGRASARAIITARTGDGSELPLVDDKYPQGTAPGEWRFTPGSPPVAFGAKWGSVKPFALRSGSQFEPGPPLSVACEPGTAASCSKYAANLEEIRHLGGDGVSAPSDRTAEQTQIALFWEESSPTSWNRLARGVSAQQGLDLWQNARLFALLTSAMADGYIASWSTKFHYKFWRPVTAVREAANDGNPGTQGDPNWMSLHPTPPVPDYESAHALEGAAAAAVLKSVFGKDAIAFATCSFSIPEGKCTDANPVVHKFASFSQAAQENGLSRIYIGFHFRDAVEKGLKRGNLVGKWAVDHLLGTDPALAADHVLTSKQ
jgi:hypothetical protein